MARGMRRLYYFLPLAALTLCAVLWARVGRYPTGTSGPGWTTTAASRGGTRRPPSSWRRFRTTSGVTWSPRSRLPGYGREAVSWASDTVRTGHPGEGGRVPREPSVRGKPVCRGRTNLHILRGSVRERRPALRRVGIPHTDFRDGFLSVLGRYCVVPEPPVRRLTGWMSERL